MRKLLFVFAVISFTVAVIVIVLHEQFNAANEVVKRSSNATVQPADSTTTPVEAAPNWKYDTVVRDAGAKKMRVGCIRSDEQIHLEPPYKDTFAELCLRSDGSAWLSIGNGQILSGETHGARIRVGDAAPRSFSLEQPSDYSSDAAFVVPSGPLFTASRSAKKIAVEATYYDAGSHPLCQP